MPAVAATQSAAQAALAGGVGEQHRFGVEDGGELVVGPQRIDFGEVGEIERALLQAREVEQHFEPGEDRIGVPVHVVEAVARLAVVADLGAARHVESGVEGDAAQADHAEGRARDVDQAHRLPEADRHADARRVAAVADRRGRVADVVLTVGEQRCRADGQREHAAPADVGDRVHEAAVAGRAGRGGPGSSASSHRRARAQAAHGRSLTVDGATGVHRCAASCRPG